MRWGEGNGELVEAGLRGRGCVVGGQQRGHAIAWGGGMPHEHFVAKQLLRKRRRRASRFEAALKRLRMPALARCETQRSS